MLKFLCLALLAVSVYSLCVDHYNDCATCIDSESDVGTACVYCLDGNSCHDPLSAAFSDGCQMILFTSLMCNNHDYVSPGGTQRVVTYDTDTLLDVTYSGTYYSTSISVENADVFELSLVRGHWTAGSSYDNFPAMVVKALSSSSFVGSEYFAFAMVPESIQEWNDSNNDGAVQMNELVGTALLFNREGYDWAFANSQNGNIWELSLTATMTGNPTLEFDCFISSVSEVFNTFNITGSDAKCDVEVTNLALGNPLNNWVLHFFFVGLTGDIKLTNQRIQHLQVAPGVAGQGINIGSGGFVSWTSTAGSDNGDDDIVVSFNNTIGATETWHNMDGASAVDVVEAYFGFINPSPGSNFNIFWDPVLSAPAGGSGVAQVVPSLALLAIVAFAALL